MKMKSGVERVHYDDYDMFAAKKIIFGEHVFCVANPTQSIGSSIQTPHS